MTEAAIHTDTVVKDFEFELTEEEFASKGKLASEIQSQLHATEKAFGDVKKDFKARLTQLELELDNTLNDIRRGKQTKRVTCEMRRNPTKFEIDYVFDGKILETRPMDAEERQMGLDEAPLVDEEGEGADIIDMPAHGKDAAWKD